MKKIFHRYHTHPSGQGMVEFALILPLLLVVMIGIVEVGRLLVTYSTIAAASREAARYASAAGDSSSGVPYYLDYSGIQNAARRIAFLSGGDIKVEYDEGPGTGTDQCSDTPQCPCFRSIVPSSASDIELGDRVTVRVRTDYEPLFGITSLSGFTICSSTSRTILKAVSIYGDPTNNGGGSPLSVAIQSPEEGDVFEVGEPINFSAAAANFSGSLTWVWTANSSAIGSSASFQHAFDTEGAYSIVVTVTDDDESASDTVTINIFIDNPPDVTITAPTNTSRFNEGTPITFSGIAIDTIDGDLSSTLDWMDNGSPLQADSATFTTTALSVGTHTISASTVDSGGQSGEDTITIAVDSYLGPVVVITSPIDGDLIPHGELVTFNASAMDAEDGDCTSSLVWTEGGLQLGVGPSFSLSTLDVGEHTIVARAVDSGGRPGEDSVTFQITSGSIPDIHILTPLAGSFFEAGETIQVTGEAHDDEDGNLTGDIEWFLDGTSFGTGGSAMITTLLTPGTHYIRAVVQDSAGNTASDTISIEISQNAAPVVTILVPATDGQIFIEGSPVPFRAIALDAQDLELSDQITWTTNLPAPGPNPIGAGSEITLTNLAVGTHTITASVTDSGGLSDTDTRTVIIRPDPCRIQVEPAVIDKKEVVWNFISNASSTYTLIRTTIPWPKHTSNQSLNGVTFGLAGLGLPLWAGSDSTAGATFGPSGDVGVEFTWTPTAPNFTFEAGPGRSEKLIYKFQVNVATFYGTLIAVFKNDQTDDLCSYSYTMQ